MILRTLALTIIAYFTAMPDPLVWSQEIARWSFEQTDDASSSFGVRTVQAQKAADYSSDVPGAFIYDPLEKIGRPNLASRRFEGSQNQSSPVTVDLNDAIRAGQSLTIEAFFKPSEKAGGNTWLVGKSRAAAEASEISLQLVHLNNAGQTWHGAEVSSRAGAAQRFHVGHYSSSTRLDSDVSAWRHLAVSFDAASNKVTAWVDYHLTHSVILDSPMNWDSGAFLIGGRPDHWGADGLIDEVRIVTDALSPHQFLRARADRIEGVSFISGQSVVPVDAGCLDVKEHFGAAGDGRTDDTAAFNQAFDHLTSRVPLAYNTLIVPPGEYLISGTLYCSRFIDVRGAGPEKTTLRLKDATFTDPESPQPVLRMSSTKGAPGSHPWVNGSSISIYLEGLTISTGRQNPGAKALEYHSNNLGRLENVVLKSEDEVGVLGLDLTHHDVGPALVKRVRIEGFETGVAIRYQEYSMTFEELTLRGQRKVGIRNQGNILAMRRVTSQNSVPALISEGANSMVTLIDSSLSGGDDEQAALQCDGGLYCLRVNTEGYKWAIQRSVQNPENGPHGKVQFMPGPYVSEYFGDRVVNSHGAGSGALRLPIEETPEPAVPAIGEWVNVLNFLDRREGDDFSPVLQAAVDSGARVVYIPANTRMSFRSPVRLRAPLQRLIGFGNGLHWSGDIWKAQGEQEQTDTANAPPALLVYDEPGEEHIVVLDRIECVHVQHASPATLVLRSSSPRRYSTAVAGGRLFAEDVGGADWHFDHPQQVWVRQWNPESHAAGPCIHSRGATIWCLGFKTEYESQKLLAESGASTEILGGFIYPIGKIPADRPAFENRDSHMALVYGASIYHANHKIHIRDVHGEQMQEFGNESLIWAGSRARMDLFRSVP